MGSEHYEAYLKGYAQGQEDRRVAALRNPFIG
jgi:hypothetical protein